MENIKEQALKTLHKLLSLLYQKHLIEHSVSKYTLGKIIGPIGKMDWSEKKKRAEDLISILETSKTEEEILQRASQL